MSAQSNPAVDPVNTLKGLFPNVAESLISDVVVQSGGDIETGAHRLLELQMQQDEQLSHSIAKEEAKSIAESEPPAKPESAALPKSEDLQKELIDKQQEIETLRAIIAEQQQTAENPEQQARMQSWLSQAQDTLSWLHRSGGHWVSYCKEAVEETTVVQHLLFKLTQLHHNGQRVAQAPPAPVVIPGIAEPPSK